MNIGKLIKIIIVTILTNEIVQASSESQPSEDSLN